MCYNCGCGLPDDDMGQGNALAEPNGKSITDKTFEELGKKWNSSPDGAKELTLAVLTGQRKDPAKEQILKELTQVAAESQGMSEDQAKKETEKLLKRVLKV